MMDLDAICSCSEQSDWRDFGVGRRESAAVTNRTAGRAGLDVEEEAFLDDRGHDRKQRAASARIEKAITYMLRNLNEPVRMSALSKLTGISNSSFYHLFKLATGCSPNDFFIRARMRHACGLLQETDLSVKEVAALLGYDDQFYFSRVFKSVHNVPPSQCRAGRSNFSGQNGFRAFQTETSGKSTFAQVQL